MRTSQRTGWAGWAALAYLAFPIYGSLVPFRWQARDPAEAFQAFVALLQGPLLIDSRPDFAANLLLAAPLALLLQGGRRAWAAPLVWCACSLLALSMEAAQMFFSGRNPALSDVLAQSIGAACGATAACLLPHSFWQRSQLEQQAWRRRFFIYLAGLALYALMPLDLTTSLSELLRKWREGGVRLLPFQGWARSPWTELTSSLLDIGLWTLAGWLAARAYPRAGWRVLLGLFALAVGLELAQLLVMSRITDVTDLMAAVAGLAFAHQLSQRHAVPDALRGLNDDQPLLRWAAALAVSLALVLLATWPWQAVGSGAELRARMAAQSWLPFVSYTLSQELSLLTSLLRRVFAFAALALAWRWALQPKGSALQRALWLGLPCAATAALIECLQLGLRGQTSDSGDAVLALLAAAGIAQWHGGVLHLGARTPATTHSQAERPGRVSAVWAWAALSLALLASLGLNHLPGLPYNVRELFGGFGGMAAPALLLGMAALPAAAAWLAQRADPARLGAVRASLWQLPTLAILLALWLLLWAPTESLHDVVGTPTLGVGDAAELFARLAVLLLGLLWALALGLAGAWSGRRGWLLGLHAVWVLPLWHGVVVWGANTDNLVELMAGGGSLLATLCWLGYLTLLGLSAAWLWRGGTLRRLLALLLMPLIGWSLLQSGTEAMLIKYGQAFSALQFLLSEDRQHYAQGAALHARFAIAHGLLLAGSWAALTWCAIVRRWPRPADA